MELKKEINAKKSVKTATKTAKITGTTRSGDSRHLYKSLFDNLFDGFAYCRMIFDAHGRPVDFVFVLINKDFERVTGLNNVIGKNITELVAGIGIAHPELFKIVGRVSLTGKPEKFEVHITAISQWFLISAYSQRTKFFAAIFQNITDRKRTERQLEEAKIAAKNVFEDLRVEKEALARAKAKDEALLESIGEGVIAVDHNGAIIIVNKAAEDLLGFASAELMGKLFARALSLEDAGGKRIPDEEQAIALALKSGKTSMTTCWFVRKDGTRFAAANTATLVFQNAKPTGTIVVFRDVTKEKEIEKLRVDFLSLASHQLRTPLSGTKWLIDTLRREIFGAMTEKQKEYLDHIYQSNERMIRLVSEMLSVLVLEEGGVAMKHEIVSVDELFAQLVSVMEPAAQSKKVTLCNALNNKKKLFIRSDFQALRSILESFIGNAINYSHSGQEIVLNAKEELDAVVFSVRDIGIGIPKDEQKKIFERFYRASNAQEFRPDGTGLGLYTSFLLSQKIGGNISFTSAVNKGTTFYVRVLKKAGSHNSLSTNQINHKP